MHYRDDDNGLLRLNPASNNHLIVPCEMNNFLPHTCKDSFLQRCLFYFSFVYFLIHNASRWHSTVHMRPIGQRGLFITKVFSVVPIMVPLWGKDKLWLQQVTFLHYHFIDQLNTFVKHNLLFQQEMKAVRTHDFILSICVSWGGAAWRPC